MGFWDDAWSTVKDVGSYIPSVAVVKGVYNQFAGDSEARDALQQGGTQGFQQRGTQLDELNKLLMQRARGEGPSVADMQGQRMLGRVSAQQQSLAAGARPGQQAMAHRLASQNIGNASAQISDATQMARLAEIHGAQGLAGNMLLGARGQDVQAVTGAAAMPGMGDRYLGMLQGAAGAAQMMSDKAVKKNIEPGGDAVRDALKKLDAKIYDYKKSKHGEGKQIGILAQDLEKAGLGQAVEDTKEGKRVDTGKLNGFQLAALADLDKRLSKIEGKKA